MSSNACGSGYCAAMVTREEIKICREAEYDDWNGLCPNQSGNKVSEAQAASKTVALTCCAEGCSMNVYEYARWNSLCPYTLSTR